MKVTKKQQQEIDFLLKHFCKGNKPTQADIEDYIETTVHGKKSNDSDRFSENPLRNAKQRLNITVSMWREDMAKGMLSKAELMEDFNCEYGMSIVNSVCKSISDDKRSEEIKTIIDERNAVSPSLGLSDLDRGRIGLILTNK